MFSLKDVAKQSRGCISVQLLTLLNDLLESFRDCASH
jgi:hypothetical protein